MAASALAGLAATWLGIVLAYDSYYWPPHGHGWPVSFFVVALVLVGYLLSYVRPGKKRRRALRTWKRGAPVFSGLMMNTWITASIVAVIAGMTGFFAVLRGQTFAAHAIPNGAFAGAAGASLLGINVIWGLLVFAVGGALAIGALGGEGRGRKARNDVVTALALVLMLGLGALFVSMGSQYAEETYADLFGEVFGISQGEVLPIAGLGIVAAVAIAVAFRPLMLTSALPEVAEARGVSTRRVDLYFLIVMALATSMTVPVVGALLMFSLMIGPAAAARSVTARPGAALTLVGRDRPGHGLAVHRPVVPDELAARLFRRHHRRGLLPDRPGRPRGRPAPRRRRLTCILRESRSSQSPTDPCGSLRRRKRGLIIYFAAK